MPAKHSDYAWRAAEACLRAFRHLSTVYVAGPADSDSAPFESLLLIEATLAGESPWSWTSTPRDDARPRAGTRAATR
jgi:hypothetical protein